MLTVEQALELPELNGSQVVAGRQGLGRVIQWVHNAGVPDAPQWLNGGELVLTTAFNLPQSEQEQIEYVRLMAERGVAALAVSVGRYIDEIPQYLRAAADECGLPLIEIPFQVRFVDVARRINAQVVQENVGLVTRALALNRVLIQLALEEGSLKQLASALASEIGQSVSIENDRFEILASHNLGEVDEARRYTLSQGRTDPRLVNALEERGVLGEIRRTLRPVFIPRMPDVGLELERILAPIVVHGDIYGYMWIIADVKAPSDLERMAIEIGATIAALMLLHADAVQSAEASLKGSLLSQLIESALDGTPERAAVLTDQALRYGVDLDAPFVVLVLESADKSANRLVQLSRRANRALSGEQRIPGEARITGIVGQFSGYVVLLVGAGEHLRSLSERLHAQLSQGEGAKLRIGVSAAQQGAGSVAAAYQQAVDALHITRKLRNAAAKDERKIVWFGELGYLHALYQAGAAGLNGNPYVAAVRRLLDEAEQRSDLFNTLEAYLDAGGNGVATAEALHIHRSTLNYRLTRITEVCEADLGDPLVRINLHVALKLMRLFEVA